MPTKTKTPSASQAKKQPVVIPQPVSPVDILGVVIDVLQSKVDGSIEGGKADTHTVVKSLSGQQFAACVEAVSSRQGGSCSAEDKVSIRNAAKVIAKTATEKAIEAADLTRLGKRGVKFDRIENQYVQSQAATMVTYQSEEKQLKDADWFHNRCVDRLALLNAALVASGREGNPDHTRALDKRNACVKSTDTHKARLVALQPTEAVEATDAK